MLHDANPDILVGWYADPHSGPENPDWARRLYGWVTWRNNYDMFCQYILFRDDWTEFYIPNEPNLRGLMICYSQDNDLIDTLAWEGIREGIDDVRYATLLKQLALKAAKSDNGDVLMAGRRALSYLAYWDGYRGDPDAFRLECINYIIHLNDALRGKK